jgi:soluble lytic murein transglycosylase-like protein
MGYRGSRQALYEPKVNVEWGMRYLGKARKLAGGDQCGMLSRYNGGLATKKMIRSYCRQVIAKVSAAKVSTAPEKPAASDRPVAIASSVSPAADPGLHVSAAD